MGAKEYKFNLNVAGVGFFDPSTSGIDRLVGGVFAAEITDTERDESKTEGRPDNIVFFLEVKDDGPNKDKKCRVWLPIDPDAVPTEAEKGIAKKKWKNVAVCVAKDPAKLENGAVPVSQKSFVGKSVFIYVREVQGKDDKGRDKLPDISIITPEQAKTMKRSPVSQANGSFAMTKGTEKAPQTPQPEAELL